MARYVKPKPLLVKYRGLRWHIKMRRGSWLLIERWSGLSVVESLTIPQGCLSKEDLEKAMTLPIGTPINPFNKKGEKE